MNESTQNSPFFEADFGEFGGKKSWSSYDEISQWLSELRSSWSWLSSLSSQYNFHIIWNNLNERIGQCVTYLDIAKQSQINNQTNSDIQQRKDAAKNILQEFIKEFPWVLPTSIEFLHINEIRKSGNIEEAGITVAYLLKIDLQNFPLKYVVLALIRWEFFEKGSKDRLKFESANFKRLSAKLESTLTQYQNSELVQSDKFNELFENINEQKQSHDVSFLKTQLEKQTSFEAQLENANRELENLKESYDKHMTLKAPVEYWETKRIKHRNWVFGTAFFLITGMIICGFLLNSQLQKISNSIEQPQTQIAVDSTNKHQLTEEKNTASKSLPSDSSLLDPKSLKTIQSTQQEVTNKGNTSTLTEIIKTALSVHLGAFILFATLAFWILRLLVRVLLSNMHLENDSAERVVMAKTYLALIRDGMLTKEDGMNTVLAALFRPSGDGIVKDEGIPPTTLDWFTKIGK